MEENTGNSSKKEPQKNHEQTTNSDNDKKDEKELPPKGIDSSSTEQSDIVSSSKPLSKEEFIVLFQEPLQIAIKNLEEKVKNEGQEVKKDFLIFFGLFASFVTFLTIEMQVFRNKDNILELVGITSLTLSFVLCFALILNDITKDKNDWKDFRKPAYILDLFFGILGITFLYFGGTSSINRIDSIERKIKSDSILINFQNNEIKNLRNKVEMLDSLKLRVNRIR